MIEQLIEYCKKKRAEYAKLEKENLHTDIDFSYFNGCANSYDSILYKINQLKNEKKEE